jgi:UDP-N-acetylmuramyl tripeptide synthase
MRVELAPSRLARDLGGALELGVVGRVYADDALAAALATDALGYTPAQISDGLREFRGVPGRFERVWEEPLVVVDYAHTPDALERTLGLARELCGGRLICVFGCGGERDPGKRPEMGRTAAQNCDVVIVTNDNPRSEDPAAIIQAIVSGAISRDAAGEASPSGRRRPGVEPIVLPDRRQAIERAVEMAEPRSLDVVVIAGKGHELWQWVGPTPVPFSDVEVAGAACRARFKDEEK